MIAVDITADLNDEDDTGYVWKEVPPRGTRPRRRPARRDRRRRHPRHPAVAEVVEVVTKPAGTVVHLRILPGSIGDYAAAVSRSTMSA